MKRNVWMLLILVVSIIWSSGVAPAFAAQDDAVLLVLPSRYSVMQVGFDVARRYPTVLVSYQGSHDNPQLHAWNGFEWMPLALADYQSGAFLQVYPARTIFIGDDSLLPTSLRSINTWCPKTVQFPNLETAALVNGIGHYLPFTPTDWRWFAGRYNLNLTNLTPAQPEEESWYDEKTAIQDPAPSFFKYFSRPKHPTRKKAGAPIQPVAVQPGETVSVPSN